MEQIKIEKYTKEGQFSYTFGAFPTFELLKNKTKYVEKIFVHSKLKQSEDISKLFELCKKLNVKIEQNDKVINKIVHKENCFVVGMFKKFNGTQKSGKHLVLAQPSDMGNMGTILRTALGFGFENIEIIKPCVDVFNPKVVRASMGAIFSLNIVEFNSIEEYLKSNKNEKFFFMLNGKENLGEFKTPTENYDLIFGNEGSGLPNEMLNVDRSVVIKHNKKIDSLNLPISVGMALFEFSKTNK